LLEKILRPEGKQRLMTNKHNLVLIFLFSLAGLGMTTIIWKGRAIRSSTLSVPSPLTTQGGVPELGSKIEGFGKDTVGGAGGTLYVVSTLEDRGPCSLRDFLNRKGPRIIRFAVSGNIELKSDLEITEPFITIDGSDAPNGGICIKDRGISVRTWEVIIRHVRVRPGTSPLPSNSNGISVLNPELSGQTYNVVIDHCSISWGTDDLAMAWGSVRDVTFQWNIISEGLNCKGQIAGCGSRGLLIGYGATRISVHHNLFAHNSQRNPAPDGDIDIVNNVIYNYWREPITVAPYERPARINIIGNYFKSGGDTNASGYEVRLLGDAFGSASSVYLRGNIGPLRPNNSLSEDSLVWQDNGGVKIGGTRLEFPLVTATNALVAKEQVLANAGATQPTRDSVDRRVVGDVTNGNGRIIGYPSDVGGWPSLKQP
jgi:pectate lyase